MADQGRVPLHVGTQALGPQGLRSLFPSCVNGTSTLTSPSLGFLLHKMKNYSITTLFSCHEDSADTHEVL